MDSNSSLVPTPHSSSWKGERRSAAGDDFAMATYNDNHSASDHGIATLPFPKPPLRIDSQIVALPEREKKQRPVSSSLQEGDLFYDSLVGSDWKSRPRNLWAAAGSMSILALLLLALIVIPLYQTDALPKRETLTMLYVPPAAAASDVTDVQCRHRVPEASRER